MPVRATRLLLAALVVFLLGAPLATPALAAEITAAQVTTAPVAPVGPNTSQPTEADTSRSRSQLVVGVSAIVLLGIVVYGNRVRAKRKKKG